MDFANYVNQLNQLDNQENKSELENFYSFNAGLLQFFKGIDGQITAILNSPTINPKSVELIQTQVNAVLPTLNKLKFEISMFDTATLSEAHKAKINQTIVYIQNNMTIGEVDIISNQLYDLLQKNETAFTREQEERKRREQAEKEYEELESKKNPIIDLLGLNISDFRVQNFFREFDISYNRNSNSSSDHRICINVCCTNSETFNNFYIRYIDSINDDKYDIIKLPYDIGFKDTYEEVLRKIGVPATKKNIYDGRLVTILWDELGINKKYYHLGISVYQDKSTGLTVVTGLSLAIK